MRRLLWLAPYLCMALAVAACGSKSNEEAKAPEAAPPEPAAAAAPAATADAAAIDASIASTERSKEDKDQDAWRRPAEVLTFMELRPGLRTLDYFAAAGYYTELMSRVVGADGKVIAYNNDEYRKFSQDGPTKRYGSNRLPNVPIAKLLVSPRDPSGNTVYAGTFLGVYETTDGGANWKLFGTGLPVVNVSDLYMPPDGSYLRVATYGRGVWETRF